MSPSAPSPYDVTRPELAALLTGEPRYRVDQVWHGLYRRGVNVAELTDLPRAVRDRLAEQLPPALTPAAEAVGDGGRTVKWLWSLADGARVETVLMSYRGRATACVSSQAGCAMGCGFCATGQAGFERHLTTGEIVEQVVAARRRAATMPNAPQRLSNVVFMGMGEPLANYERVWEAVERIHGAMGISARHVTVSTVGLVPGMRRLAREPLPVNLAVSLHAANDPLRDELVPINRRWPLAAVADACREHLAAKGRRLSFEWALIAGVNDRPSDAAELAALARSVAPPGRGPALAAHVNLIPLNPTPGFATPGTPPDGVRAFRDLLRDLGVNATIRRNRGTSIDAACGQLRASHEVTSVALAERPAPGARPAAAPAR